MPTSSSPKKVISLALQGGGAHGAYSWGVLDRLLEEEDIEIKAISGTSAGAMNAAVMVNGYVLGGRQGAKEKLAEFWKKTSEASAFSPLNKSSIESMFTGWNLDYSPAYHWLNILSQMVSPYDLNPLNINPLKGILQEVLDIDALHSCTEISLFVAATHVESGQARVFGCGEMSVDALLASACLPQMFQAVEINGEHYWDGGYMGNPVIWPLLYHCAHEDIVLVQINPIHRDGVPKQSMEILNRINEINFNSSLIAEMRAIEFVSRLIHQGKLDKSHYKDVKMHLIYNAEIFHNLNVSSKLNADWNFLSWLKEMGRETANRWLAEHKDSIGVKSSVDIREKFLGQPPKTTSARTGKSEQQQE